MILDTIIEKKKETLEEDLKHLLPTNIQPIAKQMKESKALFVIGEIKKASPSKGVIVEDFNVKKFAHAYEQAGIDAMSILTEKHYFLGSLDYIQAAKKECHCPILRKDFIMDPREIIETKRSGADLMLLIVAMLDDIQLKTFYEMAYALGLECIVEVHNENELQRALKINPQIIGINNRNLYTFEVSLDTTKTLAGMIPDHISVVSESGIFTHRDMEYVKEAGVDAVLIGESFMRSSDFTKHLKELKDGSC